MLENVLRHLKNWFLIPGGVHTGTFTIENGKIALPFLQPGQYFRVVGSIFNDGVYKYDDTLALTDEQPFDGEVWALAIPKALLDTVAEIETWQEKNGEAATGPYASESFGGYTYTKASDTKTGGAITWESAFRSRLNQWRKL